MGEERSLRRGRRVARTLVTWVATCLATCAMSLVLVPTGPGAADTALPMSVSLHAVWALHYLGDAARPALPQLVRAAAGNGYHNTAAQYVVRTVSGTYGSAP